MASINYQAAAAAFITQAGAVSEEAKALVGLFGEYLAGQVAAAPAVAGSKRPKAGTLTGAVWDICDELAKAGPVVRGKVVEVGEARGLNHATITTQYQAWKKAGGSVAVAVAVAAPSAAAPVGLVDPAGRVVA